MGREYILIVDDEPMIRQQAEAALKVMGYRTTTAANGSAALELFRQNPPDLLLTDIRMPDMDGMELFNQVRKLKPDIVTVFMTAYGSIDNVVKSMQMGVSGFLLKPFTGRELERALSDALERSRQVQEATRLHLLSPLFQLRRLLSEETELGKIYRTMVGIVAQSCKADFCAIFLPETTGSKNLVALASYSNAAAQNFSSRTFPAAKVAARTVESNRTLILRRATQTDRLPDGEVVPGARGARYGGRRVYYGAGGTSDGV
jgi:two-component system, NtrC family, response regulator AtoC